MKYVYPAIFTVEEDGGYSVNFPDFESCYTCGDTLAESLAMAEDVLAFTLYKLETEQALLPAPGKLQGLSLGENEFANYIACDTMEYRKRKNSKAVKKTLTIPSWLNEEGIARGINFSQVLQDALMEKIEKYTKT
ncbi:MAG TPA: type II toxin-antitoxin system HicB family antitoxin [Clostridia bacterium]|jgi:antitoxin HicB|nr:type II toxin-antitoxin system HicB family antitoxin [Clostridiaceae bacterium]HOF26132.1 type II toxin-antitoxin system HicB family antitoxin [Clostridia bacterium]HPD00937.1 type II toxin-antitoxin system HicB family antitoxin [Acetivibrio sp.]HOM33925.1 type II toxin-antitoxin system HicB family antitoxin [Clostridia bacterium]HOR89498.1 type II toxin-antitoxin system HicB family antitoxin [Clostridia bacterium]